MEHKCFVFSFADVEVREREFSIVKAGEVLPVEPKAFRVLLFLLHHPHTLITKDELLDAVWNDCSVSENSLTRSIALLRRLLGDDTREPRYIATVPTVGYRFLCDVGARDDEPLAFGSAVAPPTASFPSRDPPQRRPPVQPLTHHAAVDSIPGASLPVAHREGKRLPAVWLVCGLLAIALAVFLWVSPVRRRVSGAGLPPSPAHPTTARAAFNLHMRALTDLRGAVNDPALSPDGEKIAFTWNGGKGLTRDIYVQLIGGELPLRITHSTGGFICCADWSPDGRQIAFGRCDDDGGAIFTVPALGGPERKLTDVVCPWGEAGTPKWTPDGRSLILADSCVHGGPRSLVVYSLVTGEKRCLTTPPFHSDGGDYGAALSPDGQTVAFLRSSTVEVPEIYTVRLTGGTPRRVTDNAEPGCGRLMWSDGRHLVFPSSRNGLPRLWRIPAAGGTIEPETIYPGIGSLSRDGRRLVYVDPPGGWSVSDGVWRVTLAHPGGGVLSKNEILSSDGGNSAAQLSPDGRAIVFQSARSGRDQVWKSDAAGQALLQLTAFDTGFVGTPRWSPDGRWVAFDRHAGSRGQVNVVDAEVHNPHAITEGDYENIVPSWSHDGTAVYFASNRAGAWQVWRRTVASGSETQVTRHGGFAAFESPDGKTLYYSKFEGGGLWSVPVGGGEEQQITTAPHRGYWGYFAVTDVGIYLLDSDAAPRPTIMSYSFRTHRLTPVLQLQATPNPWRANLAASRDGLTLLFAQQFEHSSLSMAENFQ